MKKLISLWCLVVCMVFSATIIYAEPTSNDTDFAELSMSIVEKHLTALDLDGDLGEYEKVSETLKEYLKLKESAEDKDIKKNNYEITTKIVSTDMIDNVSYFEVNAKASWKYEGTAVDSGYGNNIYVLVDNQSGEVIDLYDRMSSFDMSIRGEIDIKDKDVRLNSDILAIAQEKYGSDNIINKSQINDSNEPLQVETEEEPRPSVGYIVVSIAILVVVIAGAALIIKKKH